jgi:hypothetical protein
MRMIASRRAVMQVRVRTSRSILPLALLRSCFTTIWILYTNIFTLERGYGIKSIFQDLRYSQRCSWRFKSSGMPHYVVAYLPTFQRSIVTLKMKALGPLELSGTMCPRTQRNIAGEFSLQNSLLLPRYHSATCCFAIIWRTKRSGCRNASL